MASFWGAAERRSARHRETTQLALLAYRLERETVVGRGALLTLGSHLTLLDGERCVRDVGVSWSSEWERKASSTHSPVSWVNSSRLLALGNLVVADVLHDGRT